MLQSVSLLLAKCRNFAQELLRWQEPVYCHADVVRQSRKFDIRKELLRFVNLILLAAAEDGCLNISYTSE